MDAGDALLSWIGDFRWHPATPAEAQARERLLEQNVRDAFAGYTLQSYDPYNSGTGVNAAYLRISDGMLSIRRATFTLEGETVADSIPVPLSETLLARLETEPVSDLIDASGWGDTFLVDDALDTGRLPVAGTVLASDLQSGGLVLLVEDAAGDRRLQVIALNDDGTYPPELPDRPAAPGHHAGPVPHNGRRDQLFLGRTACAGGLCARPRRRMAARMGMDSWRSGNP